MPAKNTSERYILNIETNQEVDAEDRDDRLRNLRRELFALDPVETTEFITEESLPEGAKGDGQLAALLVTAGLAALPQILQFIDNWIKRQNLTINLTINLDIPEEFLSKLLSPEVLQSLSGNISVVNVNGGTYVGGNVTTGRDFIGHDSITKYS